MPHVTVVNFVFLAGVVEELNLRVLVPHHEDIEVLASAVAAYNVTFHHSLRKNALGLWAVRESVSGPNMVGTDELELVDLDWLGEVVNVID